MCPVLLEVHRPLLCTWIWSRAPPQPVFCTVIAVAAPNGKVAVKRDSISLKTIDQTLWHRGEMIVRLAALHKVDVLILGAWGCGVFGNSPDTVARMVAELLYGWIIPRNRIPARHFLESSSNRRRMSRRPVPPIIITPTTVVKSKTKKKPLSDF